MTEAIAPDRVCTRRHNAEFVRERRRSEYAPSAPWRFLASRRHAEDRRRRTECEEVYANDAACGRGEGRSFSHVIMQLYPKEV